MLELSHIHFTYPGQEQLFEDLSVRFPAGQLSVILGPNGCGKSTLLKLAGQLLQVKAGTITLDGMDCKQLRPREFAKKAALLSQSHTVPSITVKELVRYGRYPHHSWRSHLGREDDALIHAALEKTQMLPLQDKMLPHLSGGQCQRAFIAMALAQDTDLLLLDEPTNALDIHISFEIMELIQSLKQEGKTVIMVLHDLPLALQYADQILLLQDGRPIAFDTPARLLAQNALDRVFQVNTHSVSMDAGKVYAFSRMQNIS